MGRSNLLTGRFMCFLRERQRLYPQQLAQSIGVDPPQYLSWEAGVSLPGREQLDALAYVLGVRPAELAAGGFLDSECSDAQILDDYERDLKLFTYHSSSVKCRRFLAFALDWNLCGLPALAALLIYIDRGFTHGVLAAFLAFPLLYLLSNFICGGRSIGKRLCGLEIVREQNALSAPLLLRIPRNLFGFLFWLDFFLIIFDGRSLADMVFGTRVVSRNEYRGLPKAKSGRYWVAGGLLAAFIVAFVIAWLMFFVSHIMPHIFYDDPYRCAYTYLVSSGDFREQGADRDDVVLIGAHRSYRISGCDAKYVFKADGRRFCVVCHNTDGAWSVCPDCSDC